MLFIILVPDIIIPLRKKNEIISIPKKTFKDNNFTVLNLLMDKRKQSTIAIILNATTVIIVALILFKNRIDFWNTIIFLLLLAFIYLPDYIPFFNNKTEELQSDEEE